MKKNESIEELEIQYKKQRKKGLLLSVIFLILSIFFAIIAVITSKYKVFIGVAIQLVASVALYIINRN
uniref:hypothetical protein n=1 Tax=Roseburia sp. TaxID=2049040 RepID=UPI003FEFCFC3